LDAYCSACLKSAIFYLSRLWLQCIQYRGCIEEKVDWITYKLVLHEFYWITPGFSSDSEVALLTDEL
jgi:hypothetical protein